MFSRINKALLPCISQILTDFTDAFPILDSSCTAVSPEHGLKAPQQQCESAEEPPALERSFSPVRPLLSGEKGKCVRVRVCVWTLCPCLTDFDHIGQLLLRGRAAEMPEMCLCVSHILHCSCSYFTFALRFSPQICPSGPAPSLHTFQGCGLNLMH